MSCLKTTSLTVEQVNDLRDVQAILTLLSAAFCIIASPSTPPIVAHVTAVMAQHTAMAWADVLDDLIAEHGGAL